MSVSSRNDPYYSKKKRGFCQEIQVGREEWRIECCSVAVLRLNNGAAVSQLVRGKRMETTGNRKEVIGENLEVRG